MEGFVLMSLKDEIKQLSGNKRRFFLLRIADMDTKAALKIIGVVRGTYNSWLQNPDFVELYHRRDEFNEEYRQEAIKLLRKDNQLEAVLFEGKMIANMKEELDSGEYNLIRTNLAREVYSRLVGDLEAQTQVSLISWEQRLQQIVLAPQQQPLIEGENQPEPHQEETEGEFSDVTGDG